VAVVDTGIDYNHADLNPNMWRNPAEPPNGLDDDNNGFVDDVYGADFRNDDADPLDDSSHGTHVAGIIGGEGNNGIGGVGVNWTVHLMALKFLDNNGSGNTADAAAAIDYAVKAGARVVNASWGGPAFSFALYKAIRNAGNQGVLVVAAAGNEGSNSDAQPEYPAAFDLPNIISVAATDAGDDLVDFSNYGARTVDLGAPGDDIYSTVPKFVNPSGYAFFSGTSMAAPFVSGAAALYLAHTPAATTAQVRDALLQNVDQLPSLAGKTVTGGRLNVGRALGVSQQPTQPAAGPSSDSIAPSPFRLISPRNRYITTRHGVRFRWQRSFDSSGIHYYKLYVDGKRRRTVHDPDAHAGGRNPATRVHLHLGRGRHRWFVRAFDYAGNARKSRRSKRGSRSTRVLFVDKRNQR
jgi:subtilisin family serine protease